MFQSFPSFSGENVVSQQEAEAEAGAPGSARGLSSARPGVCRSLLFQHPALSGQFPGLHGCCHRSTAPLAAEGLQPHRSLCPVLTAPHAH